MAVGALTVCVEKLNERFPHPIDADESPGLFEDIARWIVKKEWPKLYEAHLSHIAKAAANARWRPGGLDPRAVRDHSIFRDVIDGVSVTKVAARHDMSRRRVYYILNRMDPDWRKIKQAGRLRKSTESKSVNMRLRVSFFQNPS